jgi:hypothetical protein
VLGYLGDEGPIASHNGKKKKRKGKRSGEMENEKNSNVQLFIRVGILETTEF